MQVVVSARDSDSIPFHDAVEQRVRFVLRRISSTIARVQVQLSDVNGPRGGTDKHCRLIVQTTAAGPIIASAAAPTRMAALNLALARALRTSLRTCARTRDRERRINRPFETVLDGQTEATL